MDPADRIAAYLADELDADARRAFEDDLARDPQLRTQLDAVRRADEALSTVAPTALPEGAEARLREALRSELAATLDAGDHTVPGDGAGADPGGVFTASADGDELAARRARRQVPWTAIGGIAAAVVAVAVVAVGPLGLGGQEDALTSGPTAEMDDAEAFDTMEAPGDAGAFAGPVLRAGDRQLTEADADALLDDPQARELAVAGLSEEEAAGLAQAYAAAFGAQGPAPTAGATADEPLTEERAEEEPRAALRTEGEIDPTTRDEVASCLDELLAGGGAPVVVAAELVTFDDEPAIVYTLVGADAQGQVSRSEVWVLSRADCTVRYFAQS